MSFQYTGAFPGRRPRRMRRDDFSRRLARETRLAAADFIYPVFVHEERDDGTARAAELRAPVPGQSRRRLNVSRFPP